MRHTGQGCARPPRYRKLYPLDEFVLHRYPPEEAGATMEKLTQPDSVKVVLDPWSTHGDGHAR